jgi:probable phosphoglycerate mutase
MALSTLYLVRHGQSEWNLTGRLQGQTPDVALTALGHQQAREAAAAVAGSHAAAVYSSDLLRARQTAEPIAAALGCSVQLDPALREQNFGLLQGMSSAEALANPGYDLLDPDAHAPGGESTRALYDRAAACLMGYARRHPEQACVLVTHGDLIRAALSWSAGLPVEQMAWADVLNGSTTAVRVVVEPPPR